MRPSSQTEGEQTGPRFLCRGAGGVARMVFLPEGRHVVGRDASATLSFDDPDVSRRHALIQSKGGVVTVSDAGSKNGVWVEGQRLTGTRRLIPGDRIEIGSVSMTFDDPENRIDKWLIMHGEVTATNPRELEQDHTVGPSSAKEGVRPLVWPLVACVLLISAAWWLWPNS